MAFFVSLLPILLCLVRSGSADIFNDALPQPGTTPRQQIKCYSLPYGGVGFTTHVLTYYTVLMMTLGRSPWSWRRLTSYKPALFLALAGLPFTIGISVITMVRCRSRWVFYLLAVWKLSLALTLAGTNITTALKLRDHLNGVVSQKIQNRLQTQNGGQYRPVTNGYDAYRSPYGYDEELEDLYPRYQNGNGNVALAPAKYEYEVSVGRTFLGLLFYGICTLAGFVGLGTLIVEAWPDVPLLRHLTYGAIGLFGFICVIALTCGCCLSEKTKIYKRFYSGAGASFLVALLVFGAGAAIYSDWALAAIAGNMVGTPDGNNIWVTICFWTYFAAKRLPMLAW